MRDLVVMLGEKSMQRKLAALAKRRGNAAAQDLKADAMSTIEEKAARVRRVGWACAPANGDKHRPLPRGRDKGSLVGEVVEEASRIGAGGRDASGSHACGGCQCCSGSCMITSGKCAGDGDDEGGDEQLESRGVELEVAMKVEAMERALEADAAEKARNEKRTRMKGVMRVLLIQKRASYLLAAW